MNQSTENLPSLFAQARELVRQGLESAQGLAQGKRLLASEDVAKGRLAICDTCEFLTKGRCLKCGCFMDKKVHLAVTRCPVGKWTETSIGDQPLAEQCDSKVPIDITGMPEADRIDIMHFAEAGARRNGVFWYKNTEFSVERDTDGVLKIYQNKVRKTSGDMITQEERAEFDRLALDARNRGAETFEFKGRTIYRNRRPTSGDVVAMDRWTDDQRKEFQSLFEDARANGVTTITYNGRSFPVPPLPPLSESQVTSNSSS